MYDSLHQYSFLMSSLCHNLYLHTLWPQLVWSFRVFRSKSMTFVWVFYSCISLYLNLYFCGEKSIQLRSIAAFILYDSGHGSGISLKLSDMCLLSSSVVDPDQAELWRPSTIEFIERVSFCDNRVALDKKEYVQLFSFDII